MPVAAGSPAVTVVPEPATGPSAPVPEMATSSIQYGPTLATDDWQPTSDFVSGPRVLNDAADVCVSSAAPAESMDVVHMLNDSWPTVADPTQNPSIRHQAFSGMLAVLVSRAVPPESASMTFPAVVMKIDPAFAALVAHTKTLCWLVGFAVKYRYSRIQSVPYGPPVIDANHWQNGCAAVVVVTCIDKAPCAACVEENVGLTLPGLHRSKAFPDVPPLFPMVISVVLEPPSNVLASSAATHALLTG